MLVRRAGAADLAAIVALLADDQLGAGRDDPALPLDPCYAAAFSAITADPHQLLAWAAEQSRTRGCDTLQLASSTSRIDAHHFYEQLAFTASHVGYKLALTPT